MRIYSIFDNIGKNHVAFFPAVNDDVAKRSYAAFCAQNKVVAPDCSLLLYVLQLNDEKPEFYFEDETENVFSCTEIMNFGQYLVLVSPEEVSKNGKKKK